MSYEAMRRFTLQAAHRLPNVPPSHKCYQMHGHTWQIEVWCEAEYLTPAGWVLDFADIAEAYDEHVHRDLDHTNLCEHIDNPTTENLCREIARRLRPVLPGLCRIVARENDYTAVELRV